MAEAQKPNASGEVFDNAAEKFDQHPFAALSAELAAKVRLFPNSSLPQWYYSAHAL